MSEKKILIVYASETGNTEIAATKIQQHLGEEFAELKKLSDTDASEINSYKYLVFGSPTWGSGEYHDDFFVFSNKEKDSLNLHGKKVAIFGLGDQKYYGDTFVNGMRQVYDLLSNTGAEIVGKTSTVGYDFENSDAVIDGYFVGLVLDEDNQSDLSEERIANWVRILKTHFI